MSVFLIHRLDTGRIVRRIAFGCILALLGLLVSCGGASRQQATEQATTGSQQGADAQGIPTTDNILIFGNSLTAGYGLADPDQSFPSLIQQRIDSLGLPYRVINAGLSGETSAAGYERVDWLLNEEISIFLLELGANDGLRGLPIEETHKNLQGIIDKVVTAYPNVKLVLAGMLVPPNMGETYAREFAAIFPALARENDMALVPFLLDGVAGDPTFNLHDGIHPNAEGQQIVADNVWQVLEPLL